jgi:hypothetical protein
VILLKKIKRTPVPKRAPAKKSSDLYNSRQVMLKWKTMREAEERRRKFKHKYTRYKNNWLISLIKEATRVEMWSEWEIIRIKKLRILLEDVYCIPLNYMNAYIYFATYRYMSWSKRSPTFSNYIGFISNEGMLTEFARFLSTRSFLWRRKNARWPEDFEEKWGIRLSYKAQKLGLVDKHVKYDIMSKQIEKKINKHL